MLVHVAWDDLRLYRAFIEDSRSVVSLVSSHVSDQATGVVVDEVLLLVTDSSGKFCDLELHLDQSRKVSSPQQPVLTQIAKAAISVSIDASDNVRWHLNPERDALVIEFGMIQASQWIAVSSGSVVLGLTEGARLGVVCCHALVDDPSGALQEQWIREAERSGAPPAGRRLDGES